MGLFFIWKSHDHIIRFGTKQDRANIFVNIIKKLFKAIKIVLFINHCHYNRSPSTIFWFSCGIRRLLYNSLMYWFQLKIKMFYSLQAINIVPRTLLSYNSIKICAILKEPTHKSFHFELIYNLIFFWP